MGVSSLTLYVRQRRAFFWFCLILGGLLFTIGGISPAHASEPIDNGYRDFSFGSNCISTPTGEKPESKLWFNDGLWWGSLCNDAAQEYHIYRFDRAIQDWIDTGTVLDDRTAGKADTLWDETNQKLYVVSHPFTTNGQPTSSSSKWGRLYRFSYDAGTKTYSLDAGFPVNVTRGTSETLVIDKDSTGRLWVTYVENSQVMVNHSINDDLTWGEPFVLPVAADTVDVTSDDISSVIAFQGNKNTILTNISSEWGVATVTSVVAYDTGKT